MPEGAKRFINGLLAAANLDATQINYSILAWVIVVMRSSVLLVLS